ncbi:PhzF family phenazine biosynthesis protein [Burkholderia gladioli]|uniref:PhzF family phenazine biosynthesis protein n=1 Tax=Burkholderia gladioli TaxID=28095 RepID=UPI0016416CE0|nr:PhzF family phenazine biosynthesis isomerase [Burkholderia gladioli]MBU9381708.1 PhzF family phenazine biosynthesis isomerase [Burkholderia gladioli]
MSLVGVLSASAGVANDRGDPRPHFLSVFPAGAGGGNPAPVVLDADTLPAEAMKAVAARYGHESAFVCMPEDPRNLCRLRFFVPEHEMEMCGHATLGAMWLLRETGRWSGATARVETLSGVVELRYDEAARRIDVSQPRGSVQPVEDAGLLDAIRQVLRLDADALGPHGIVNACTSRTKTLVPIRSVERLHAIAPRFDAVRALCDALGSTGLYPFAIEAARPLVLQARQFPRGSGYPEDAATGIAAAASLYGALHHGLLPTGETAITIRQGVAMGRPSSIGVALREPGNPEAGCWISGAVEPTTLEPRA